MTTSPPSKTPSSTQPKKKPLETVLPTLQPYLGRLASDLRAEWHILAAHPDRVANLAVRFLQNELVVPLIDEADDLRAQLYSPLARRLIGMIRDAERLAVHTCPTKTPSFLADSNELRDSWMAEQTCGACLLARIGAEVWINPTVDRT